MRVTLPTVVVALIALSIDCSAAADPECIYRQIRNLPMHWINPTDCGRFYRCTNKNIKKEIICTREKVYNPKTGKCTNAGRGVCKLSLAAPLITEDNFCANEVTGAYIPQGDRCRDFYICNDKLAYPQSCDPGSIFNATSANCVPDVEGTCWQNLCLNKSNGISLPAEESCLSFYVCNEKNAILQSCGFGNYFNKSDNNCQPDLKNDICWENFCLESANGEVIKNPKNCHGFYVCNNKTATPKECAEGEYFDWKSNTCQPGECPDDETNNNCTEPVTPTPCEDCTCPGGYKEGDLLPYPGNCQYFYICTGGVLIQESCQEGNYFNENLGVCSPDVDGVCPECSRIHRRARRSEDCTCPGGYKEGDLLPYPGNCQYFYICKGGVLIQESCQEGNYFNENLGVCSPDVDGVCPECSRIHRRAIRSLNDELEAHTKQVIEYMEDIQEADHNEIKEISKENVPNTDEDFTSEPILEANVQNINEENQKEATNDENRDIVEEIVQEAEPSITIDNTASEQDKSNCTCPGGYQPGQIIAHPTDCDKFYVCQNGQLLVNECGQGNMFSNCDDVCVPDTEHICWPKQPDCNPNVCVGQPNGQILPNPNDCTGFYQCLNGVPQAGACNTGEWFNPGNTICEIDTNAVCINPCANVKGILFLPHPDCTKFYFCNNGQSHIESCNQGGFNIDFGVCTLNATCEASMCTNKPDGTTFPIIGDKTKFYLCLSGNVIIRDCLPNTEYNEDLNLCMNSPSTDCDQSKCASGTGLGSFPTLSNSENSFCSCRNGSAYETDCPYDYVFNAAIGICYSNAPCDPESCQDSSEYTVSMNRNDTHSFCLCIMKTPVIVDCPYNATFYPKILRCRGNAFQDPNCNPTFCLDQPDYTTAPALNSNVGFCVCEDGGSKYQSCTSGMFYNPELSICLPASFYCDVKKCANGANTIFPAFHDPYAFCYCQSTTQVELRNCPDNTMFSATQLVCMPELCDSKQCIDSVYQNEPFPAIDYPYGYCLCNESGTAVLHQCSAGQIFDKTHLVCTNEVNIECNISLCQQEGKSYPYDIPAIDDPYSFCYCIDNSTVEIFHCPFNKIYKPEIGACLDVNLPPQSDCDTCTCPGGYPAGSLLPHPQYCSQYYVCSRGVLQLENCGTGNFFNASLSVCQPNLNGACTDNPSPPCTCVGAYHEGELIANPNNRKMYYRCINSQLRLEICTSGYSFSTEQSACVPDPKLLADSSNWLYKPRSIVTGLDKPSKPPASTDDLQCDNNTKRSVPSNCSQYEICRGGKWRQYTCANQRYYNPEEQKCLEPRDDTICNYAKVQGLPACNNQTDQQTLPHKHLLNCSQYFRCARNKWRLKSCSKNEFYSRLLRTCMPTKLKNICEARNISETEMFDRESGSLSSKLKCRHTAVRPFMGHCSKYLMCLEDKWWHQYCPFGMYFNHTLNYCMPNDNGQCIQVQASQEEVPEFTDQSCMRDGELRPSALACDRFYICKSGQWRRQTCGKIGLYYNVTSETCAPDVDGICEQMAIPCRTGDRREFPLNCTAYEICENGLWMYRNCDTNWTYDVMLQQCVSNKFGQCSVNGLRKACQSGEIRPWPLADNCTNFLYCKDDSWLPATCLKGHTFSEVLRSCVPHIVEDRCTPMWNNISNLTTLPSFGVDESDEVGMVLPSNSDICLDREDGTSVAHPSDCTRFYICVNEIPSVEQQCTVGSFFDSEMSYCRPNNGNCILPLTGPCQNASDGELLPNDQDCRSYYNCSLSNGGQLLICPDGTYFHKQSKQCRKGEGDCRNQNSQRTCTNLTEHGSRLPHEIYCNIYYACVKSLAIPLICPNGQIFNSVLGHCIEDNQHECLNGELLVNDNETSTIDCGNITDGTYLPNLFDCTRFFICSSSKSESNRCPTGTYYDSQQQMCVPDDGSCPFVGHESFNKLPNPPDPKICEGKHGNMFPDPANCNEFYVCINGKLKHERCYTDYFFNNTINQCQIREKIKNGNTVIDITTNGKESIEMSMQIKCTDKAINFSDLCTQIPESGSIAEHGDCRRFIKCQDNEPISQRCRNGESYDSLLGFCRQNDGTCLLENGQRVGECNKRHGQLARDAENCRGYFVCINGQKISNECRENEYFDRVTNTCQYDDLNQCNTLSKKFSADDGAVSCQGLSETVLYPYVHDRCRSYFQCVKGSPKIHECTGGLYFDTKSSRCVKEIQECTMPNIANNLVQAPESAKNMDMYNDKVSPSESLRNWTNITNRHFLLF